MSKNGICMSIFIYNSETSLPNIFSKLRSPAVYNPKTNVTTNLRRFASPFDQGNSFHAINQALAISLHINTVLNVWEVFHSPFQFAGNNICSPFTEHANFSLGCLSFSRIGQTVQPPFLKPLHKIADFCIAPVLKDNQPLYSESFLVLCSSARSISGKQLVNLSLSLFNYSLKGYYYYNYVLWPFDQQGLIGYFFHRNVWCNKTHHCQPLLCKPTFSWLANAEKKIHFFSKLVFHFYY